MKTKYVTDPAQEIAKSLSSSLAKDEKVSKLAVKIALLKSLPRESWISRVFNRISVEQTSTEQD
jgi:hypothetical protein